MSEKSPPLPITFDTVTEDNIEQLRVLNRAIFPINYPERMYQDIMACGEVTQLAFHNNDLVGAIGCRLENTPEVDSFIMNIRKTTLKVNGNTSHSKIYIQGPKLYILTLGVLAPYRNLGVGSRLLEKCLSIVTTSLPEVVCTYLHVQTSNIEAIEFYKKFGFEEMGVIENYYKRIDPPHAVILQRRLGALPSPHDPDRMIQTK